MTENARRSHRANKGVPPNRYSPYDVRDRASSRYSTTPSQVIHEDCSSEEDPSNQAIVSVDMSTTSKVLPTNESPPPPDPTQIRELPGSSGLPLSNVAQPPPCPMQENVTVHFQNDATVLSWSHHLREEEPSSPIDDHSQEQLQQFDSLCSASAPPPSNQADLNAGRLGGLLPPASPEQTLRTQLDNDHQPVGLMSAQGPPLASTGHDPNADELPVSVEQCQERIRTLMREARQYRRSMNIMRIRNDSLERSNARSVQLSNGGGFTSQHVYTQQNDTAPAQPQPGSSQILTQQMGNTGNNMSEAAPAQGCQSIAPMDNALGSQAGSMRFRSIEVETAPNTMMSVAPEYQTAGIAQRPGLQIATPPPPNPAVPSHQYQPIAVAQPHDVTSRPSYAQQIPLPLDVQRNIDGLQNATSTGAAWQSTPANPAIAPTGHLIYPQAAQTEQFAPANQRAAAVPHMLANRSSNAPCSPYVQAPIFLPTIPVQPLRAYPTNASASAPPVADYYVNTYHTASSSNGTAPRASSNANTVEGGQAWRLGNVGRSMQGDQWQQSQLGAAAINAQQTQYLPLSGPDYRQMSYKRIIDLPTFSGRPEEWPKFICSFHETTQAFGYSDLDNMSRLEKALVGAARTRTQHILICPQHVGKTIETLAKAFGRPEMLAESQLAEIRKFQKIGENRLEQLADFSLVVDGFVSFLDAPATADLLDNCLLLNELTAKLPTSEHRAWAAIARHFGRKPSIRDFARWLSESAEDIANIQATSLAENPSSRPRDPKTQPKGKHVLLNVSQRTSKKSGANCGFCGEPHVIDDCAAFRDLCAKDRLFEVRKRPLCYMCLGADHLLPGCNLKKKCGVDGCERRHHQLLHDPDGQKTRPSQSIDTTHSTTQPPPANDSRVEYQSSNRNVEQRSPSRQAKRSGPETKEQQQPNIDTSSPSTVLSCQTGRPNHTLFYRIVPVVLYGPTKALRSFALLDEGSSVSLIDADLAKELQLEGEAQSLDLQFVSGKCATMSSRKVCLGISGIHKGAERFELDAINTSVELSLPVQTVDRDDVVKKNPHLSDVPFSTFTNVRPKILLGLEHHYLGVPIETRTSLYEQSIVAARTRLGWILYGCCGRPNLPGAVVLHARYSDAEGAEDSDRMEQLHELVRRHFTTEDFGVRVSSELIQSDADRRARRILAETTNRVGDRFETGLLWKQDVVELPDSYPMAVQRLESVEAKMRRNPEYAKQYRNQIAAYLEKGYARKMTPDEASVRGPRTWFLPHFAVQNPSKPGKFRLVFDAAACAHRISLNDVLLSGPDLNVPLTRLLFRFRLGVVGVCADVKEMFHQVLVRKDDQDAQRFLWRDGDRSEEPGIYVMNVMTFGSTCSPTSAQFVKNANAEEFAEQFPEAADAVRQNHYVDDYVASFPTSEAALKITAEVIDIHRRGGFELRGVISNCPAVRSRFGAATETNQTVSLEPEDLSQKILGMTWETGDDTFGFKTRFHRVDPAVMDGSRKPTKREILSVAMSIFDPFGLLADFLLPTKTILQELWRIGSQWDEQVPDPINKRWQSWRAEVEKTRRVRIARCYSPSIRIARLQLHIFADASEEAFAAVSYWRIENSNGVELAFVAGKVRCAPIKLLSIPRLELQAAVLATRLMLEVRQSHAELDVEETVFWTDSETVLKWLRCDQRRYVPFVAHRVAEVVESAPSSWWRWVPTAQNVADDATRGKTPITFDHESRWLHGPAWLKGERSTWPMQRRPTDQSPTVQEELRSKFIGAVFQRGAVDFHRFSKMSRLTRCLGWVERFIWNVKNPNARKRGELTAHDIERSTEAVCRLVQREAYAVELAKLRSGKAISSDSKLFILKPYLDDDGVLRLHGRTDAAQEEFIPSTAKRPIIMPEDHHVSMIFVRHYHEYMAHQLTDATITAVRTKFWIPKLRSLVRSVQAACQLCRVRAAKPTPPMQGQLPPDRMNAFARPFTTTGLDFFGPYYVTVGRRREKRWVALFTCMAVRAVHLEVAADLSTDACLVCLRNFCNLRGVPSVIRCDNGTNFVGAKNELGRDQTFFDPQAIQRELSVKGVQWKFNCPNNPEAGGAWERLVQAVKRVLNVTLHEAAPRVETFRALLLEAANIVNARPLTHVQVDPNDPEPLTPNHLLLGGPNVATVPNPCDVEPTATRRQWQICRGLSRKFWTQFVREYLPELTRRSRHYPDQPPLQIGDVVFVCDNHRATWSRGIITAVNQSIDGVVRRATVRTAHGEYQRPAARLAKIDVGPPSGVDGRGAVLRTDSGLLK